MYGDRARIGLIIPSVNTTIEPEFNAMKPEQVSVHTTRLVFVDGGSVEGLKQMAEGIEEASRLLASAGVDIIAYGCTTGSLVKGIGWDRELIAQIEKVSGIPATTTATAVIRTFETLRIRKVAVATPYSKELNLRLKEFFKSHGIEVTSMKGLDIHGEELRHASPEITADLAREVNAREAEAIFISCTNLKSITVIDKLEKELKKVVFSSNTATMWDVIKRLCIHEQSDGYGKLFQH